MSQTWYSEDMPEPITPRGAQWLLVVIRAGVITAVFAFGVVLVLILRLIEPLLFAQRRPWTGRIKQAAFWVALQVFGLKVHRIGTPLQGRGAVVSNHVSWLDIIVQNAGHRVAFVSKAEVARWPVIGWLARLTGTVFIRRDRRDAVQQQALLGRELAAGRRLLLFPEGTSSDGQRVLPFKSTLFGVFYSDPQLRETAIQPVSIVYDAPAGEDQRFYGWWGDLNLAPHLLQVLAQPRQGEVTVRYHTPVAVSDFEERKALAHALENAVRRGMPEDAQKA